MVLGLPLASCRPCASRVPSEAAAQCAYDRCGSSIACGETVGVQDWHVPVEVFVIWQCDDVLVGLSEAQLTLKSMFWTWVQMGREGMSGPVLAHHGTGEIARGASGISQSTSLSLSETQ